MCLACKKYDWGDSADMLGQFVVILMEVQGDDTAPAYQKKIFMWPYLITNNCKAMI